MKEFHGNLINSALVTIASYVNDRNFMKFCTSFFLVIVLALLFCSKASAQLFEGVINMEISSPILEKPMTMAISVKGDRSMTAMQTSKGNMNMYFDKASGKLTTVLGSMKIGFEMDMKQAQDTSRKSAQDTSLATIEATGEKQVISGHHCELYHVTNASSELSNWWTAADLPKSLLNSLKAIYDNIGKGGTQGLNGPGSAAIQAMFKRGLMPVQVESIRDGKPETTITFLKHEQKHLDDSVFAIPADVKIRSMPNLGGGQ